jgi:hypothetical protein
MEMEMGMETAMVRGRLWEGPLWGSNTWADHGFSSPFSHVLFTLLFTPITVFRVIDAWRGH